MQKTILFILTSMLCNQAIFSQKTFPGKSGHSGIYHSGIYNIKDYGALGDGKHLDSKAINLAIEACAGVGGGIVQVPAGTYLCGSIHLKSHIRLDILAGAIILGAPAEMKAYDTAEAFQGPAYQDGGHTYFHNSLIWGENLTDVSITGQGMINGGGLTREDRDVGVGPISGGDKSIALKSCSGVLIRDITIFHGGHFAILVTGCDRVTIDNVTIDTNRDGMDLDACSNTIVSDCRVNSPDDDAICPKSSFALKRPVATENLLITNCEVSGYEEGTLLDGRRLPSPDGGSTGRIKFGTESNGGFKNCVITNCTFSHCMGLALEEVDGGTMEDISISNITMQDVEGYPIYITLGSRNRGPSGVSDGKMKNITISNIVASGVDSKSGIQITGLPGNDIEGLKLDNIQMDFRGGGTKLEATKTFPELAKQYPEPGSMGTTPSWGLFVRHVRGLDISGVSLNTEKPDLRPVLICSDVEDLDIDRLRAPVVKGVDEGIFTQVKGLDIENSSGLHK